MVNKELNKNFTKFLFENEGLIFSNGTLCDDILCSKAYDLMLTISKSFDGKEVMDSVNKNHCDIVLSELRSLFKLPINHNSNDIYNRIYYNYISLNEEEQNLAYEIWNDVVDFFESISPDGYYFGINENNSSLFGWFEIGNY